MNVERSDFYKTETLGSSQEKDLLYSVFKTYKFKRSFKYYRIKDVDIQRPDSISFRIYGTNAYWWIILRANPDIQDVWNDFVVGELIQIPDLADIEELYALAKSMNNE